MRDRAPAVCSSLPKGLNQTPAASVVSEAGVPRGCLTIGSGLNSSRCLDPAPIRRRVANSLSEWRLDHC
eukprot:4245230-Pyramimonas_sp.AAC.1